MLHAQPGRWSPDILEGVARVELGLADVEKQVVLGVVLQELLEEGVEVLTAKRGRRDISLSGTNLIISATPAGAKVALRLTAVQGRRWGRQVELAQTDLDRTAFADALVGAALPLLERLQRERGPAIDSRRYWAEVSDLVALIRRWRATMD
jgi:hypothetical protein